MADGPGREALVERARAALATAPGLSALFVSGSLGAGTEDEWSDIDLVGVAERAQWPALSDALRAALGPLALWKVHFGGALSNAVTPDWERIDLYLTEPPAFAARNRGELRALHDPDDLLGSLGAPPEPAPSPANVTAIVEEFLRVIGLMPVVMGRAELVTAVDGAGLERGLIADLMIEEAAPVHRGGALHLSRLIPAEDHAALAALPYPRPEREEVIEAHLANAALFLPRARALAARIGAQWPQALEEATRRRLRGTLGIELPDG